MNRLWILAVVLFVAITAPGWAGETKERRKPNIIFIMADDLGFAELGCYGQKKIRTPFLDQMAKEGIRFTQHYAGNAVCAPSRCVLMTGLHSGHTYIRNNKEVRPEGQAPIPDHVLTVAEILKQAGYVTGCFGKWGLGPPNSEGDPLNQGFDEFYGYNCQRHAHNFYPRYLYKNRKKITLKGNNRGLTGKQYSHDLLEEEALGFIRRHQKKSFFLYVPFTIPHLALQVPEDSLKEYKGKWEDPPYKGGKGYLPHPHPRAAYAAMVTRMDRSVGRILALLRDLNLDEDTIIFFTSDNGATYNRLGGSDSYFFFSNGLLREFKGSLHEGGIRVPMIVRWKGKIKPETKTDLISAFYDVMPTLCDIAGAKTPKKTDGISFLPTLLGKTAKQKRHEYLYWEFSGYGGQQAVRMDKWKAIRKKLRRGKLQVYLYDLEKDISEKTDVAQQHPKIVQRIEQIMRENHTPSKLFPIPALDKLSKR
ncbi:MAG: arylsulfatase [Gemmataceae bacterium]